ncbi:MAG: hypothetical protein KBC30_08555 [Planctomycetes bacterium]|jgi:hypothetical protein|nr:hypothetical protein [Planctomycetota bacterium]HPY73926.1 hypothetical protein [Planctomycetota bacterium]HQA99549.1 hypothetical protein [Planctomycetota bacterium]
MLDLSFCGFYSHAPTGKQIRVFRQCNTGEALVLEKDFKMLCGYRFSCPLFQDNMAFPFIHYVTYRNELLVELKMYLQEQNISGYKYCRSITFLTETGLAYLLSKFCSESILKMGTWLISEVFIEFHQFPVNTVYFKQVDSLFLNTSLIIFLYKGRPSILSTDLANLLHVESIEDIFFQRYGYIPELHLIPYGSRFHQSIVQQFPSMIPLERCHDLYLFYESGIYRLLRQKKTEWAERLKNALEREVFPLLRRPDVDWQVFMSPEHEYIQNASVAECNPTWQVQEDSTLAPITNRLDMLENAMDRLESFLYEQSDLLQEMKSWKQELQDQKSFFSMQVENSEKIIHLLSTNQTLQPIWSDEENEEEEIYQPPEEEVLSPSLLMLKEIAFHIGLYYLDRCTPHIRFVRMLIQIVHNMEPRVLLEYLHKNFHIQEGVNRICLQDTTYHVWKQTPVSRNEF